jgi:hypothetical protein
MKNIHIIDFLALCFFLSCNSGKINNKYIEEISAIYVIRNADYLIPVECGMIHYFEDFTDTCVIKNSGNLKIINNLIKQMDTLYPKPTTSPDIRIQCLIHYNNSTDTLCFGEFNTTILNGYWMEDSDSLTYYMKKSINYYDSYQPKEFLKMMPEYVKYEKN